METFAYIESAIAHEEPDLNVRLALCASPKDMLRELGLTVPSSAWVGLIGILLSASMLVAQVPQAQAIPVTVRASSGLTIRSGPSFNNAVIGGLSNGATVQVASLATTNGFYQLSSGGWISAQYTSTGSSSGGGGGFPGGSGIDRRVTVTGSVVNVRNGPSTSFGLNGRPLYAGETVRVVRLSSNGWYQLPDGGWFSSSFARPAGSSGGGGFPGGSGIDRRVTVTGSVVNVRNGPSTSFGLNGRPLYAGERVRVVRLSSNGWYQLPDGGWFSSSFATTTTSGGGGGAPSGYARVSTNGSSLLVRSSPSGNIIGSLANGTSVRLSGRYSSGFAQLSSGGWVSSSWIV